MQRAVRPSLWVLSVVVGVLVMGHGCSPNKRDNPLTCGLYKGDPDCPMGQMCDPGGSHYCVSATGGAAGGQGVASGGAGDAGAGGGTGAVGGGTGGTGGETGGTAGTGTGASGGQGGTPADGGMDAGDHCLGTTDCTDKTGLHACDLAKNACVECTDDSTCFDAKPGCDTDSETCVACTKSAHCGGATPVCDTKNHQCVACLGDGDCKTAEKSFCSGNVCVACNGVDATACGTRDMTKPVCATSGACVACDTNMDCKDPTAPFCGAQKTCIPCDQAGQGACMGLNSAKPFCGASGACVACKQDGDCSSSSSAPFCSAAGTCVGCGSPAALTTCMTLTPATPFCSTSGGACVQCLTNTDCPNAQPVCSGSNTCVPCTADTDCAGRGPGVCMSHLDGRCAANSETIYVQNSASCSDSGGTAGGTTTTPFCSMQPAPAIVSASRSVIVVRGNVAGGSSAFASNVSIVGQSSGAILGSVYPSLHVSGGSTYARDLKLSSSGSMGLQADSGSTVKLEHLLVTSNATGGIQLDGAAFDIHNTTVSDNNMGTFSSGVILWAGILVNNPPSSGSKSLRLVTVQDNKNTGIVCSASSGTTATGVFATGNTGTDIGPACNFTSCSPASLTCGAQP